MQIKLYLPAEWEEQNFVQLVFPHEQTDWNDYLAEATQTFVNIANVIAKYQKESDDTWSRDFGGITVNDEGSLTVLDFKFNAWGKKFAYKLDDQITKKLKLKGMLKQYKHKKVSFVLEGGAIESNGAGVILTTSRCLLDKNRNPMLTQKAIEKKLIAYLGAKKVLWLNHGYLEGDDTDSHIDTLARFIDNETIVYQSCDDQNDIHYEELNKMKKELNSFKNINGKPFKLVALPWIEAKYYKEERLPATYANFLIINGAVLIPTYDDKNDSVVLSIFKKLFPKRDVVGIDSQILIRQHGSLHCVTMQYPMG